MKPTHSDTGPAGRDGEISFAVLVTETLGDRDPGKPSSPAEPLAHLPYDVELALKTGALRTFWERGRLPAAPAPIVPSPRPRRYRTTTKRRVVRRPGGFVLEVGDSAPRQSQRPVRDSALEPHEHAALYRFLAEWINQPLFRDVAARVNFLIVRGSYERRTVIFNVDRLDAMVIRRLRTLADRTAAFDPAVASAFIFHDPLRSRYYLDSMPVEGALKIKRLFGPGRITIDAGTRRYGFHPAVFSQVNESMIAPLLAAARRLLRPAAGERLIDLYCGYGLFTLELAPLCAHALGIETEEAAVESARDNARHQGLDNRAQFRRGAVTPALIETLRPAGPGGEIVLLDPPRAGTAAGVVPAIAAREPARVLEVFCDVNRIPRQVRAWSDHGYRMAAAEPLDMFPGTPHLEVLVLLEPGRTHRG